MAGLWTIEQNDFELIELNGLIELSKLSRLIKLIEMSGWLN